MAAFVPTWTPSAGDTILAAHLNQNFTDIGTYINSTPDIGTPSAGVLTNCTGTAASLTAGAVSTITGLAPDTATTQAAQPNITSVGTLTTLSVDNITINGNTISSTAGTDLNITPLAGQQVVLDGTIVIDAGIVTGATSITSVNFIGDLTGDVSGNVIGNVTGNVSGNADTVTTNANLTGPITSSGNATSINSQTGTGSQIVVSQLPTIVEPTIASMTNAQHDHEDAAGGGLAKLLRSYLAGLGLSNNGTQDIDIAVGECRDNTNGSNITISSALTKQLDASWVTGDNQGGLSSSLTIAGDTWYHVFAITVAGVDDIGFDTSVTAANLVFDHSATAYRRIGSILTDATPDIIPFYQYGDYFRWDAGVADWSSSNPGTSAVTRTLTVPTGIIVRPFLTCMMHEDGSGQNIAFLITSLSETDRGGAMAATALGNNHGSDMEVTASIDNVFTNTSAQIRSRVSHSDADIQFFGNTHGWVDRRGQDD